MGTEVGNFSFHPNISVLTFQMGAYRSDQAAYRPNTAFGGPEAESKLVGRGHCEEFTGEAWDSAEDARV